MIPNFLEELEKKGMGMQIMALQELRNGKSKKEYLKEKYEEFEKFFGKKPTIKGSYMECNGCGNNTLRPVLIKYIDEYSDAKDKKEYIRKYPEKLTKPVEKWKKCSWCKLAYYCNKECQLEDWPNHKKHCKKIRAI